jgi:hypothetical protein
MLHRLVYHALPSSSNSARSNQLSQVTSVLTFEIVFAQPKTAQESSPQDLKPIPEGESESQYGGLAAVDDEPEDDFLPHCLHGRQSSLDIMMPDR